ncbi:hypothetical protein [Streptomyces sp. CB03911]|uniref:hypothetical protein n=1 Tax=Streptomyces sp. CB03911 TaxID=1804758 RepID=UPI00093D9DD7|nr:hypothetical protein [Streptomyces sp. CB03911]OKI12679.1 hypothetical protein A6A07_17575 [Streptomyces sp. CB03911]
MPAGSGRSLLTRCNHCRSPLAERILSDLGGTAVEVRSAGLIDTWGQAHPEMTTACALLIEAGAALHLR